MMLANDLKKGDRVHLNNGWSATVMDNMRGNIRLAQVEGFVTELGSIYIWDIVGVELTAAQEKARKVVKGAFGF
jgi:preprotein translocase subunit YajC